MKSLIIFGAGDIAQLAHYYFSNDTDYKVIAFTVDAAYINASEFCGLPVVPFEEVISHYPPVRCEMFIALGFQSESDQKRKVP